MPYTARLVAAVRVPLDPSCADAPQLLHGPDRSLLVQRADDEVTVIDLGDLDALGAEGPSFRFPAPWLRAFGQVTIAPSGDLAVFAGVHSVRAVDRGGDVRWELVHGCWATATCTLTEAPFTAYADDSHHRHADHGSAAFSPDGKLVWAHIRNWAEGRPQEEWLVLNAADGAVLGRTPTMTAGSGFHFPHPNPAHMGLTVGEGHEDSPSLWGRWDGSELTAVRIEGEMLQSVSPSGQFFLGTDPGQWALYLHEATEGRELRRLNARDAVPPAPGDDMARWDYEGAYPYENGAVVGTEGHAENPRHWLVDPRDLAVRGMIAYPGPVVGSPRSAGPGRWYTLTEDATALHVWSLADEG
ncbi:hypothetical protein [Saccharopolyspora sp. NPDC002376]